MAQVRITLDQDLLDTLHAQTDQTGITLSALIAEKAQYAPAARITPPPRRPSRSTRPPMRSCASCTRAMPT